MFLFGKSEYHGADRGLMHCSPADDKRGGASLFSILSGSVLPGAKNSRIAPIDCIYQENLS
jgi:hypothetical protein